MKKRTIRGTFDVGGRKVPGILTLNGRKSTFELWSDQLFSVHKRAVHGISSEARAVSVLDCLPQPAGQTMVPAQGRSAYTANVRFHLAIVGDGKHLQEDDESIVAVRFEFDDLGRVARLQSRLPYGFLQNPDPRIVDSLTRYKPEYATDIDNPSAIIYFGGNPTVLPPTTTEIGTVSITRGLAGRFSRRVVLDDRSSVTVAFLDPVTIHVALDRMRTLRSFFTLVIGHLPTVQVADIATVLTDPPDGAARPDFNLKAYSTGERVLRKRQMKTHSSDRCLVDCGSPARQRELASVMRVWLRRNADPHRKTANWRFFDCFRRRVYTIDRMIAAANMFDLLPRSDWPHPGMKDLKKKVRAKAAVLLKELGGENLPRFREVIDHAVDCRNHYVHGTAARVNYERALFFLVDTLEFTYGVSQLIECGWNSECLRTMRPFDHPFSGYLCDYSEKLNSSGIQFVD